MTLILPEFPVVDLDIYPHSINNRLIVEPYVKEAMKAELKHGFAFIEQKTKLKGLKLLIAARVTIGTQIVCFAKGSTVYIKEELLHTQPWAQKVLECPEVEGPFIIVDLTYVELVGSAK